MNRFPTIGGARGIFEIFVPGVFLLLNVVAAIYMFPLVSYETRSIMVEIGSNPVIGLIVLVSFGYLMGVILRLFRAEAADRMSAWFLRIVDRRAWGGETENNRYAYEKFPYSECLETVCNRWMHDNAISFYNDVWKGKASKSLFNFCKIIITISDERSASEIYSAESLSRYISGMLYALAASTILLLGVWITDLVVTDSSNVALIFVIILYLFGIFAILRNFRFIRLKEVETIFAVSFKNRKLFYISSNSNSTGKIM
jgi:hypothetical protein